jgi:hypothetical protein
MHRIGAKTNGVARWSYHKPLVHNSRANSSSAVSPQVTRAQVNKWTRSLINAAAVKATQWKYTNHKRTEEKRLKSSVMSASLTAGTSSKEKTAFFASDRAEEADIDAMSPEPIEPGSFVESRRYLIIIFPFYLLPMTCSLGVELLFMVWS